VATSDGDAPAWCCPEHLMPLRWDDDLLTCPVDGAVTTMRNGVPSFVDGGYADAFGTQWERYPRTQLDSHTGLPISRTRLRRCLGQDLWGRLADLDVLEVGCGAGRFTEVLLAQGARVTSVDLSSAAHVNAANFPVSDRHRVAQADVMQLPFAQSQFDLVVCLGVVQHTPVPELTMAKLAEQARAGGWLVLDHYARTWRWYTRTAPLFRAYLRRRPAEQGLRACERLVDAFYPLHRRARARLARVLVNRVSPITVYDDDYPELGEDLLHEWAQLDTHDMLTDWYKHRRSASEVGDALRGLGLTQVWCAQGGNGVEARAQKPGSSRTDVAGPTGVESD
jgi:SAM-dependent methyltransferase